MSKHYITLSAIAGITLLAGLAVAQGMDGVVLASSIGAIAGLGGFVVGKAKK